MKPLWIAAILYLAFRVVVLHTGFDTVAIPSFEVTNIGSLAKMTSEGHTGIPLFLYYDNCGGHLVTGLLAAPLYALFGDSYAVLKVVPLLLGLGCLILIWRILERHASRRAAILGALLFTLGPPTLAKFSMVAQGNHFENVFFQIATYALFLRVHDRGRTPGRIFALGAAAGFALFFYFGSAALLAGLAASHLAILGPRRAFADLRFAVPGFLVGVSPLAALALAPNQQVQRFVGSKVETIAGSPPAAKAVDFFGSVLPRAGGFADLGPLPGRAAETLYLACFALAWILSAIALVRAARPTGSIEIARRAPLLFYLPIVAIVAAFTTFRFGLYGPPVEFGGYRYLVPHFAFAAMLIPFGVETRSRGIGRALLVGSAATCLFTLPLLFGSGSERGLGLRYRGFVPRFLSAMILHDWDRDPVTRRRVWDQARVARRLEGLSAWERHGAMEGVGHMIAWEDVLPPSRGKDEPLGPLPLRDLVAPYAEPYAIDIARGAGGLLRRCALTMQARTEVEQALREVSRSEDPLAPYVVEGLCLEYSYPLARQTFRDLTGSRDLRELVPPEHRKAWASGFGLQCGRLVGRGIPADVAMVLGHAAEIDAAEAEAFWTGLGWGIADQDEEVPGAPELERLLAEHVPAEHRDRAREGFARAVQHLAR